MIVRMKTLISRVSQTSSTSIFDLSSVTSLYTDSGLLRFLRLPIKNPKIQLNFTLQHPSSWLSNKNLILFNVIVPPLPPAIADPTPQPATAGPDVVDPIESSQQPKAVNKHLSVIFRFQPLYFLTCPISDILSAALDSNVAIGTIIIYFVSNVL